MYVCMYVYIHTYIFRVHTFFASRISHFLFCSFSFRISLFAFPIFHFSFFTTSHSSSRFFFFSFILHFSSRVFSAFPSIKTLVEPVLYGMLRLQ